MGITVDLSGSNILFNDPLLLDQSTTLNTISGNMGYDLFSFEPTFEIKFDSDPRVGIGGAPAQPERWKIGIVQNILYESLLFEYENSGVIQTEFKAPAIDCVRGTKNIPFYADPQLNQNTKITRPMANIIYTAQGYREENIGAPAQQAAQPNKPTTLVVG